MDSATGKNQICPGIRKIAIFYDLLCCFGFHGQLAKTLYCSKLLQKQATLRNPQQNGWNPEQVSGIREQIIIYVVIYLLVAESAKKINVPTKFTLQVFVRGIH